MTDILSDRPLSAKVEALAGYGLSDREIARVLDIGEQELKASLAAAVESGRIKANVRVAENLYRKATGEGREAVTAAIFWLKTRARWKETSSPEADTQPVIVQIRRFAEDRQDDGCRTAQP